MLTKGRSIIFGEIADIFSAEKYVCSITLAEEGAGRRIIDPVDRVEIRRRWEKDRARQAKLRFPKQRIAETKIADVYVRSPAFYDALIPGGAI